MKQLLIAVTTIIMMPGGGSIQRILIPVGVNKTLETEIKEGQVSQTIKHKVGKNLEIETKIGFPKKP